MSDLDRALDASLAALDASLAALDASLAALDASPAGWLDLPDRRRLRTACGFRTRPCAA